MKVVVLGAGLMGKEVARDLNSNDQVKKIYLADINTEAAKKFVQSLQTDKIEVLSLNAKNEDELRSVMARGDVCVNALFYAFNEIVARTAIDVGVHSVDLGGHIGEVTDHIIQLHNKAVGKNVTIIPDLGVAPGMINILAGYGASKLEKVESIKLYVGGIPTKPEPPLNYTQVFSLEGVIDHYTEPAKIIVDGEVKEVKSLSGIESIYFEQFGVLEAFYTSGGTSTLIKTFPNVKTLEYKTIRYKSHAEKFQLLVDLGFFDKESKVEISNTSVPVRDVVREALKKKLDLGDQEDAVLLRAIIEGEKEGEQYVYEYELNIKRDEKTTMTAMARATACTIAAVAIMVGNGVITKRGVYPPEQIVPGKEYIKSMAERGVNIKETSHRTSVIKW